MATSILFVSADPRDALRLRLGEELREISAKLQIARLRDEFNLEVRASVRAEDLSQAMLDVNPAIVHFSGHGSPVGAICLEDHNGDTHEVSAEALGSLFESFGSQTRCVVLNACYSSVQAEAIARHVAYVIGMSDEIDDSAAIAFSVGFYQAIGAGRSIEDAFDLGCTQLRLRGIPEHSIPRLLRRKDLTPFNTKRVIPMHGGTLTLLRRGRTVSDDPLDRQRIGLAAFMDPSKAWELVAVVAASGDPEQSGQVTSAAMQALRTYVESILTKRGGRSITAQALFKEAALFVDFGVRTAIKSMGLPESIGARLVLTFRVGETAYVANVGACGALAVWPREEGTFIRPLNLKAKLTMDMPSPAAIEMPLGHLLHDKESSDLEALGWSGEIELNPEPVPLGEAGDFLVLTSYALPSSDPAREEFVEQIAKRGSAENVSQFLIENDLPEESAVVCYSWDRPLEEPEVDD